MACALWAYPHTHQITRFRRDCIDNISTWIHVNDFTWINTRQDGLVNSQLSFFFFGFLFSHGLTYVFRAPEAEEPFYTCSFDLVTLWGGGVTYSFKATTRRNMGPNINYNADRVHSVRQGLRDHSPRSSERVAIKTAPRLDVCMP